MSDKKPETRKFVVIKNNTLNHKVGDVIELTARQAKNLIGKIRSHADVERDAAAGDELKLLAEEIEALKAKIAELEAPAAPKKKA
jgi:hypothetical protein